MRFHVAMVSCDQREPVRDLTLASWAATDWGGPPLVALDDTGAQPLLVAARIERTWLGALREAVAGGSEFVLLLEDDLEFNRHLRHNLEGWPPLRAVAGGERPLFGSLYHHGQRLLWQNPTQRYGLLAPEAFWGAQALLLSRATARHLLASWPPGDQAHDLKAARLAAQLGPIYGHLPCLVQHRVGASTWGGTIHQALDFDPDYRAA